MADDASKQQKGDSKRATDHLANERTFLAWLRTGLNVIVVGLAIAKFVSSSDLWAVIAGVVLVATGLAGLVYGTHRYHRVNEEIESGDYTNGSAGRKATIATAVLVAATLVALVLLLIGGGRH